MGVQLELSQGLRETLFFSLDRAGRTAPTQRLDNFCQAIWQGLEQAG